MSKYANINKDTKEALHKESVEINGKLVAIKEPTPTSTKAIQEMCCTGPTIQRLYEEENENNALALVAYCNEGTLPQEAERSKEVLVFGCPEDWSEDILLLLFESTRRSGGGPVKNITLQKEEGIATVAFEDAAIAERVANKKELDLLGNVLRLELKVVREDAVCIFSPENIAPEVHFQEIGCPGTDQIAPTGEAENEVCKRDLSLQDIISEEDYLLEFRGAKSVVDTRFENWMRDELRKFLPEGCVPEAMDILCRDDPDGVFTFNIVGAEALFAKLREAVKRKYSASNRMFLFVSAPLQESSYLSLENDSQKRTLENNNFIKAFRLTSNSERNPIFRLHVRSYEELKCSVKQFFEEHACNTFILWVFWNGHGTDGGYLVFEEGEKIHVDLYIAFLKSLFDDVKMKKPPFKFPCYMQIILSQCYGHMFSPELENQNRIFVHSLSSPDMPQTVSYQVPKKILKLNGELCEEIADASHLQLNSLAKELNGRLESYHNQQPQDVNWSENEQHNELQFVEDWFK